MSEAADARSDPTGLFSGQSRDIGAETWHPPMLAPAVPDASQTGPVSGEHGLDDLFAHWAEDRPTWQRVWSDASGELDQRLDAGRTSGESDDKSPAPAMGAPRGMRGNCTGDQWYALNLAVKEQCKVNMPRACVEGDSPELMEEKAAHYDRCIDARQTLMDTCFDGGDAGHERKVEELKNGRNNCIERITRATQPAPAEAPDEDPHGSKSFRERMAEITGLSGLALTLYLIVSEGSRIIPLRNAIPIP